MTTNWREIQFGDVTGNAGLFLDGDWIETKDQDPNGDVRLIQLADIGEGHYLDRSSRFLTSEKAAELKCTFLKKGDLLVARMPDPLGRACVFPGDPKPSVTAVDVCIVRPDTSTVDIHWLKWVINSPRFRSKIERYITGTTRKRISRKNLQKIPVKLPPLPEQRRIAAILDKADAVRCKRQQTLDLADQFLRSAFLDIFGDPVTNPKDWEIVPLEQVCTRITDGTHQPPDWSEHGLPFLFVSNIVNGRITFQTKKHISEETWKELTRRCPIEVNDILYTTVGSYGNAALVDTDRRFAFQRHIAHIKPDGKQVHPEFLVGMLQSHVVRKQADHAVRGIAQKTLNLGDLKRFRVFQPPRDVQERFVRLRRSALEQRELAESAVASADNLLDSLVQRAFRGELA